MDHERNAGAEAQAMTTQAKTAGNSAVRPEWTNARRIVVKIGSALLTDRATGTLKTEWLASLLDDVAALARLGKQVVLVSSGAIALGRHTLKLPKGPLELEQSQAAAAVGQISLAHAYQDMARARGLVAAQILLTLGDTEERRRYLNARHTIETLLELKAVPVVNENDTVATTEIRYGDNDRLSARVASMVSADCLVLLSDVDGLYTAPPNTDANASRIDVVTAITPEVEAMAGDAGTELSKGGMRTRSRRRNRLGGGTHMVIASGKVLNPLKSIGEGAPCTWFLAHSDPMTARKRWISGQLEPKGHVYIDAGAERLWRRARACCRRASTASKAASTAATRSLSARRWPRAGAGPHFLCQRRGGAYHRQEKRRDRHYIGRVALR